MEGEEHVVEEEEQGGGNGRCSARAAGPATEAAAGATGFHFQDPEAARQFRQSFAAPSPGRKGRLTGIKRRSWAGAAGAAPVPKKRAASPGEKAAQQAWDAFARAWREKNKPSGAEIKRAARDAAAATAAASAARDMRTPMQRLARERAAQQADAARAGAAQQAAARRRAAVAWAPALLGPSPAADDLEARRMHFRHACQRKVAGVSSFVEVRPRASGPGRHSDETRGRVIGCLACGGVGYSTFWPADLGNQPNPGSCACCALAKALAFALLFSPAGPGRVRSMRPRPLRPRRSCAPSTCPPTPPSSRMRTAWPSACTTQTPTPRRRCEGGGGARQASPKPCRRPSVRKGCLAS